MFILYPIRVILLLLFTEKDQEFLKGAIRDRF